MGEIAWWKRIITKNDILKINLSGIKYIFGQEALSEYILKSKHSERDGASMSPKKSCYVLKQLERFLLTKMETLIIRN